MSRPRLQFTWTGEEGRPLTAGRPCSCGCDERHGKLGVGYLTGSDSEGRGFTLWIETEEIFKAVQGALQAIKEREQEVDRILDAADSLLRASGVVVEAWFRDDKLTSNQKEDLEQAWDWLDDSIKKAE